MSEPNLIPQSTALLEAEVGSLVELLGRDPERLTTPDRGRIVAILREQRARWEAAEASGETKKRSKQVGKELKTSSDKSAEDLGL